MVARKFFITTLLALAGVTLTVAVTACSRDQQTQALPNQQEQQSGQATIAAAEERQAEVAAPAENAAEIEAEADQQDARAAPVSTGGGHACALGRDGTIKCWMLYNGAADIPTTLRQPAALGSS